MGLVVQLAKPLTFWESGPNARDWSTKLACSTCWNVFVVEDYNIWPSIMFGCPSRNHVRPEISLSRSLVSLQDGIFYQNEKLHYCLFAW